jgi:hypothetical protein
MLWTGVIDQQLEGRSPALADVNGFIVSLRTEESGQEVPYQLQRLRADSDVTVRGQFPFMCDPSLCKEISNQNMQYTYQRPVRKILNGKCGRVYQQ